MSRTTVPTSAAGLPNAMKTDNVQIVHLNDGTITSEVIAKLYQLDLYDPRYTMEEDSLIGIYQNSELDEIAGLWILEVNGKWSGVALLHDDGTCSTVHVFIDPSHRRCGYATLLLEVVKKVTPTRFSAYYTDTSEALYRSLNIPQRKRDR